MHTQPAAVPSTHQGWREERLSSTGQVNPTRDQRSPGIAHVDTTPRISSASGWKLEPIADSPQPKRAATQGTSGESVSFKLKKASPKSAPGGPAQERLPPFSAIGSARARSLVAKGALGSSKANARSLEESNCTKERPIKQPRIAPHISSRPIGPVLPDGTFVKNKSESIHQPSAPADWSSTRRRKSLEHGYSFYRSKSREASPSRTHFNPLQEQPALKNKSKRALTMSSKSKLSDLLDQESEVSDKDTEEDTVVIDGLTQALSEVALGVCVECEEVAADFFCIKCDDYYCDMCFSILHRKGNRAKHNFEKVSKEKKQEVCKIAKLPSDPIALRRAASSTSSKVNMELGVGSSLQRLSADWFAMRARYIPIRLTLRERKRLRLAIASMTVSDYTGRIDKPEIQKGAKRQHMQLKEMCSNFTGVITALDRVSGMDVAKNRDFTEYSDYLKALFEYTRRYKVMNPEKLRTSYGKLIYMLQDAADDRAQELLQFSLAKNIMTVYDFFEAKKILGVLAEPDLKYATLEILPENKSRSVIQSEIKRKEGAQERIARKYCGGNSKLKEDIKWCLYSISDNFSFLNSNRKPIDEMISYLKDFFDPKKAEDGFSFAISGGVDGARLTHDHTRHYNYVLQSLTLWREICDDMFRLWSLAEEDLTADGNRYVLKDTGQGLQRVQASQKVLSAMRSILHNCQTNLGEWVGSSVIHLGDANVPNAMLFVDKYTQIARILTPIIQTIKEIDILAKEDGIKTYINTNFRTASNLKKIILHDFFKNAFDGSGADNFFDAGSCIDGRLTSAWNWCSSLKEKKFFPIFSLSGFVGFDGSFQE